MTSGKEGIFLDPIDAAKNIIDSPFGVHCLVIYPNLNRCREFYSYYIQEIIKKENEIIEFAPFYETEDSVRSNLPSNNHNKTIDRCG